MRLVELNNIYALVFGFFNDAAKTELWLSAQNPFLGNTSPRDMIRLGRHQKLLSFVTTALEDEALSQEARKKVERPTKDAQQPTGSGTSSG